MSDDAAGPHNPLTDEFQSDILPSAPGWLRGRMTFNQLKRREFISLAGSAVAAWPLVARAQQSAMPVVALVNPGTADATTRYAAAFRNALGEAGFVEGQNVTIEYHWLGGRYDRLPTLMADIVRRRVTVIATPGGTSAALAVKAA